ncbi:uncharacterized protein ATC70_013136 [Mucor velutinosus]|uniref:F-box domain-containing protein n=1 Tax=Mucor velutinosus TaxID=708070 RepID=A0AAN7DPR7_9FUNG|nr:hypothetical protein ATC70_013136 [Mucor velutinosus]
MERLPSELRYTVFSNACNPKECRLVCKRWYAMITDDLIHHSVRIMDDTIDIAPYEKCQDLAHHVRDVYYLPSSMEKVFALPGLFPNVRHLHLSLYGTDVILSEIEYRHQIESLASIPYWTPSIVSITENNYSTPLFTSLWLETAGAAGATLANLTELHIKMLDYDEFSKHTLHMQTYIVRKHQFVHSLRLAIALRHLTLEEMHVFWQDLDAIHENVPGLRSLSLINTTLRLNENAVYPYYNVRQQMEYVSNLPSKQASGLRHLHIDLHSGTGLNGPQPHELVKFWIQQVASKYMDLVSFTLKCNISMRSTDYKDEHALSMLPMMASCQRLSAFKIILYPITKELINAMDENKIKLHTLGFATTNNADLKKQLAVLSESNQSSQIQRLSIQSNYAGGHYEYTQKRALREEFQPFDTSLFQSLSAFSQLTTLEFNCTFGRSCELAHLLQILTYCRSLRSLALRHVSVSKVFAQHSVTTKLFPRLEYLTITKLNIKRDCQTLVETNTILRSVLEGLQGSLRMIYLEFGSITLGQNKVDHPLADYIYLDLSKSRQLRELSVTYALGSNIITTERGDQRETHEFERNNLHFTKISSPTSHYQTKVILPQQAIKINALLVL